MKNKNERKLVSIVSPCFNEQDNVRRCYETVRSVMEDETEYDFEHIFADNDSSDETVSILREIASEDARVRVIVNARNYGPFRSSFNALKHATGDIVIPMLPVDLQDPPELLPRFLRKWEEGFLKVYGVRESREESRLLASARSIYYRAVSTMSNISIPQKTAEFQLLDRRVVNALLRFKDHYPYIRGMIANVGFDRESCAIPYTWVARTHGNSKNRWFSLLDQGLNGIISFTNFPMRFTLLFGFVVAAFSIIYAGIQIVLNLLHPESTAPGIATVIVAMFFFAGVQLFIMGMLGEYIAAIHAQIRQGDIVIERETINLKDREN